MFSIDAFRTSYQKFSSIGSKLSEKTENKKFKTIFQEKNHSAALRRSDKRCMVFHNFRALKVALGPFKKIKKKLFLTPLNLFYNMHYVVSYVARGPKMAKMGPPPFTSILCLWYFKNFFLS